MRPKDLVHRIVASMGRPDANALYLKLFQAESKESFALVIVTPASLEDGGNALISDLIFLSDLELSPVICVDSPQAARQILDRIPSELPIHACTVETAAKVASEAAIPLLTAANAAERADIAQRLQSRKVVYLIAQSGLQPRGRAVRSLINMRTDYQELIERGCLPPGQAALLTEIGELFEHCGQDLSASVTSPHDLLRELFTVQGAGTLVRRGAEVATFESYKQLQRAPFIALLESAFGRPPLPSFFDRAPLGLYLASKYQGAAVLEHTPLAPYLSKFAVAIRAQGEGIGRDLWSAFTRDHPRFFWRSRADNPIASWYASKCDGMVRRASWTVFWRGLEVAEISEAIALAEGAPQDFEERAQK